jgi:hypothetical protein
MRLARSINFRKDFRRPPESLPPHQFGTLNSKTVVQAIKNIIEGRKSAAIFPRAVSKQFCKLATRQPERRGKRSYYANADVGRIGQVDQPYSLYETQIDEAKARIYWEEALGW